MSNAFQQPPDLLQREVSQNYEDWRDDVYRYLVTLGLRPELAQEATQEVFLRLYTTLRSGPAGDPLRNRRAWVFRVAHNLGLTMRGQEAAVDSLPPELEANLPDNRSSAERDLIESERLGKVERAVKTLSPQQRDCLYLRAEGMRYQEIADTLGIGISTVSTFLERAVLRLRKAVYE